LATRKLCVCDHVFETLARQKFTLLLSKYIRTNWLYIYLYSHCTCRAFYLVIMDIIYLLFFFTVQCTDCMLQISYNIQLFSQLNTITIFTNTCQRSDYKTKLKIC